MGSTHNSKTMHIGERAIRATYTINSRHARPACLSRGPRRRRHRRGIRRPLVQEALTLTLTLTLTSHRSRSRSRAQLREGLEGGEEVVPKHGRLVRQPAVLVLGEAHEDARVARRELVGVFAPEGFLGCCALGWGGRTGGGVHGLCDGEGDGGDVAG